MGALFKLPEKKPENQNSKVGSKIKLTKNQSIEDLIENARKIVEEKLKDYKNASTCITDIAELQQFFINTADGSEIGIDTETTGLNTFSDTLVGISLCNRC